ncbi:FAD-dependent oxidoreductase, partial [Microbacterium sp.]|uniref:NAD(P)/FAD-dependent oxidoreductase n=1 Tax=Microbacterium sp. TaxID=51671 RepID=UPI0032218495
SRMPDDSLRPVDDGAATSPAVVVVGAGIVGAALAYRLATRGRTVALFDAGLPASGATGASFGWIGRPGTDRRPSAALRRLAVDEWHRLEHEVPGLNVRWTGSLTWGGVGSSGSPGHAIADAAAIEPRLAHPPADGRHEPADGAVEPTAATEALVAAARAHGAELRVGVPVTGLVRDGSAVTGIRTGEGTWRARTVVLAAGVGAVALCAGIGIDLPVRSSPAVMVRLRAEPGWVRTIVGSPDLEVRQEPDGTLLVPLAYGGETDRAALRSTAERARRTVAAAFDGMEPEIVSVEVGWRPMPADEEPIVGPDARAPGLYLATMHSGVSLAAAAARLAAEEIATGLDAPELAGCRLARFDG